MSKPVDVVLVPGLWLGGWAWDGVGPYLETKGLTPHPVTLPGLERDAPRPRVTLDHHIAAVREVVAHAKGPVLLAGHGRGATIVNGVLDLVPELVARAVYIDDTPLSHGERLRFGGDLDSDDDAVPMLSWEELDELGMRPTGVPEHVRAEVRRLAAPEPAGSLRSRVRLGNPRRRDVPVTVICCSRPAGRWQEAIEDGAPFTDELQGTEVTLVDFPTGHWPMFSRPEDLAWALDLAADQ